MDFNITLNIIDLCATKGSCNKVEKEVIVTDSDQTIELQCCYILNVIKVDEESATILIQDGVNTYIRIIYFDISSNMCLPCKCANYRLNITITDNSTS